MFKNPFFNTINVIALSAILLCSCLQLKARLWGKIGNKEVSLIELPCHNQLCIQRELQDSQNRSFKIGICGSCAFENSKILARKDLDLKKAIKELNSNKQKERIKDRVKEFGDGTNSWDARLKWGEESDIELKRGEGPPYNFEIKGRYKNYYLVACLESEELSRAELHSLPMVLMISVTRGGINHFVTARIEETKNGYAILLADSLFSANNLIYQGVFKELIEKIYYRNEIGEIEYNKPLPKLEIYKRVAFREEEIERIPFEEEDIERIRYEEEEITERVFEEEIEFIEEVEFEK